MSVVRQNPWWQDEKFDFNVFGRKVLPHLFENLFNQKILALVGSRQVGKTSLVKLLIEKLLQNTKKENIFYFNLDDISVRQLFDSPDKFLDYLKIADEKKYVFIDEVQRLKNPGLFLKAIHDLNLNLKIVVSGSSQLELKAKLKEFLVGRLRQFEISRLTFAEFQNIKTNWPASRAFEDFMIYGSYPEVAKTDDKQEKKLLLQDIISTYLKKDISDFAKIDDVSSFNKLLILLASQTSNLLNIHKLSDSLKVSSFVLKKYLDILEGTFIIKLVPPFFNNYQKEVRKTPKIYFLDLGLRNALLKRFDPLELRDDKGALFENFVFLDLYANDFYKQSDLYFWRTTNQTEIDFIKQTGETLEAFEVKYSSNKTPKSFATFQKYYPDASAKVVTPSEYL
jgi:predicted AAA+ superfamily ATPase